MGPLQSPRPLLGGKTKFSEIFFFALLSTKNIRSAIGKTRC